MFAPIIYFTLTILSVLEDAGGARVLGLFPHTGRSHQMVFEPMLRRLAERGHHVTVVSFFPLNNAPPNYTDISLEGIAPLGVETFDLNWVEGSNPMLKKIGIERIMEQIFGFHPLAEMATSVCRRLVELPALKETLSKEYDVVLVENFNSDCMLGLMDVFGLQVPKIALLSSNMMPWSAERIGSSDNPSYVPIVSTEFTENMNFFERLENIFMQNVLRYWFRTYVQAEEQKIIEDKFGVKVDLQKLSKNTSLMLVNTFHGLNGVRPLVPGLVEVGGMHLSPSKKLIPDYIEKFLNESDEGVILFSWGSLIKTATIPAYKEEILIKVLSKLPQRVIWKYENAGPQGNLTRNILRVNWIPQYELLQHKKVIAFIAHGGLLGMTEAISAGKPMLVVPFFGDQPCNGAAARSIGLATVLKYADLDEETFSQALKQVLSAQLRLSARQASKIWKDRLTDPLETAVYWIERVARWGHAATLHSASRELPTYQYALLDVIGTVVISIALLLLALRSTIKFIIRIIWSLIVKEPKRKVH